MEEKDEHLTTSPSLQEMILEYAWTHKMKDLQEVVDTSLWMEARQQYRSLKESCRLRVASAQAYSILKNRDVGRYERVIAFLEASHRLLPKLVVAIKHMKIMFGLKTLVIMWMLKQAHGLVPILIKIFQFFPSTLPQYQDHCSKKDICLMQRNHMNFKLFAQSLAMDRMKLNDYIKDQLEEQYGEHYAQKVEDRLLHYVHKLEKMLPRDTYVDQILQRERSMSHEEKMLLEVIAGGPTPISTSLRTALLRGATSYGDKGCGPGKDSLSPAAADGVELVDLVEAAVNTCSSRAPPRSDTPSNAPATALEDTTQEPRAPCLLHLSQDSPLLSVMEEEDGGLVRGAVGGEEVKKGDGGFMKRGPVLAAAAPQRDEDRDCSSLPQFCTKHQRWVRSFLSECSRDSPAEGDVPRATSPLLFPSSASSSSQDLTPSDLVSCHLLQAPAAPGPRPPEEVLAHNTAAQSTVPSKASDTGVPNPSPHSATPTPPPVHQRSASDEASALSLSQPDAPWSSPDVNHRLTAGCSPGGAEPPVGPAIAALARTLPAHRQQTASGGLCPSGHAACATALSSGSTSPRRRRRHRLSRACKQEAAPLHPGSSVLSSVGPPSTDLHTASPVREPPSVSVLSPVPCPPPVPGARPALDGPPRRASAEDPRAPALVPLLQPYVRLVRLLPQQHLRETRCRVPPDTQTPPAGRQASAGPHGEGTPVEEDYEEEEEEEEFLLSFDPNLLFSGDDSSDSDCGDPEDLEYVPSKP